MEEVPIVFYRDGERKVIGRGEVERDGKNLIVHVKIDGDSTPNEVVGEYSINDVLYTKQYFSSQFEERQP